MILPNKYLPISDSLIGVSSLILNILGNKQFTLDELWDKLKQQLNSNGKVKCIPSYNKFVLAINFMFMSRMINYNEKGVIYNENIEHENL